MANVTAFNFVRLLPLKIAFEVLSLQERTFRAFCCGFENLPGNFRSVKNGQLWRQLCSQANFQPLFSASVKHKLKIAFCLDYLAENAAGPFIFDSNFQVALFYRQLVLQWLIIALNRRLERFKMKGLQLHFGFECLFVIPGNSMGFQYKVSCSFTQFRRPILDTHVSFTLCTNG